MFAGSGGYVDITSSTTPELVAAGDIPALEAFDELLRNGAPADRISLSSDAGGSLPVYVDGELTGLTQARPDCLLGVLQRALAEGGDRVVDVIAALTRNPASALGLPDRGRLVPGALADLLLVDPGTGTLDRVMGRGRWLSQ